MDGKCFLCTARLLLSSGADEADYRSAVSRAYYACFLEARQAAFDNCDRKVRMKAGIWKLLNISHKSLQQFLKWQSNPEPIRKLGENLAGLCGNRNDADYDIASTMSSGDAKNAIAEAEAFLTDLHCAGRAAVGKAVEAYIYAAYQPAPAAPAS